MIRRLLAVLLAASLAVPTSAQVPPIPGIDKWESDMLTYGAQWKAYVLANPTHLFHCGYYDMTLVFHKIAAYTGDTTTWYPAVDYAQACFIDEYAEPADYRIPEQYNNINGLIEDYLVRGDTAALAAAVGISENAAGCSDDAPQTGLDDAHADRFVAHCVQDYLYAESRLGEPHRALLNTYIDYMIDYLDQWFVTKDYIAPSDYAVPACQSKFSRPIFRIFIVINALILFVETHPADSRVDAIVAGITDALEDLWDEHWDYNDTEAFGYEWCRDLGSGTGWNSNADPVDDDPAHVLNNFGSYSYAWMYKWTGDTLWRDRAFDIFEGGSVNVGAGTIGFSGKQFNEHYRYSFDTVELLSTDWSASNPPLRTLEIDVGSTFARFKLGADAGLDYGTDCTVTVETAGGDPVEEITSTQGFTTRVLHTTETLTASTNYKASQSCVGLGSDSTEYAFTTSPVASGSNQEVSINIGEATTYSGGSIAKAVVQYDDSLALSLTATNAACPGACTITLTIPPGRWYYRVLRQTAGSATVVAGGINSLYVP